MVRQLGRSLIAVPKAGILAREREKTEMTAGSAENSSTGPILASPSAVAVRAELVELVVKDLLGPAGGREEEVDETRVRDRYLVGMLAPRRQRIPPEEQDGLEAQGNPGTEDGSDDGPTRPLNSMFTSSLGLSFCVPITTESVHVTARWGVYSRAAAACGGPGPARAVGRAAARRAASARGTASVPGGGR